MDPKISRDPLRMIKTEGLVGTESCRFITGQTFKESPAAPVSNDSKNATETLFSEFGDRECGEPQTAQEITIDFTPNEMDTDEVQEKVCKFWDMIHNHPELKLKMALPDQYSEESSAKGDIQKTFSSSEEINKTSMPVIKMFGKRECTCPNECAKCKYFDKIREESCTMPTKNSSPETAFICEKMTEWEEKHPKDMDGPKRLPYEMSYKKSNSDDCSNKCGGSPSRWQGFPALSDKSSVRTSEMSKLEFE